MASRSSHEAFFPKNGSRTTNIITFGTPINRDIHRRDAATIDRLSYPNDEYKVQLKNNLQRCLVLLRCSCPLLNDLLAMERPYEQLPLLDIWVLGCR